MPARETTGAGRTLDRTQALAFSTLLALATAAGVWALTTTHALRAQPTKAAVTSDEAIARRTKQLDAFAAALASRLRARPPALPALPRYGSVARVHAASGALPALAQRDDPAPPPTATAIAATPPAPAPSAHPTPAPTPSPTTTGPATQPRHQQPSDDDGSDGSSGSGGSPWGGDD